MCEAGDYESIKRVEPDIDKCLKNNEMTSLPKDSLIFFGDYGGVSMDAAFMTHMIDSKNVNDICDNYTLNVKGGVRLFNNNSSDEYYIPSNDWIPDLSNNIYFYQTYFFSRRALQAR